MFSYVSFKGKIVLKKGKKLLFSKKKKKKTKPFLGINKAAHVLKGKKRDLVAKKMNWFPLDFFKNFLLGMPFGNNCAPLFFFPKG